MCYNRENHPKGLGFMRYAIISDIHGNLLALDAALQDAANERIDEYLFLGDYYADFPYLNEVARRIQTIPNARAVRGNKEDYLMQMKKQDPANWTRDQMAGLYYNYRAMEPEVLRYYVELPAMSWLETKAGKMVLMHDSRQLFSGFGFGRLDSTRFSKRMKEKPFTRPEFLSYAEEMLNADGDLRGRVRNTEGKLFLFGHSHVQWHAKVHGAYFINAGSCGLPLDWDTRAAYTILEIDEQGNVTIEERRVEYDIARTAAELSAWEGYQRAPVWYDIILEELPAAVDYVNAFFDAAAEVAESTGWTKGQPYSNEIWNESARVWRTRCFPERAKG